MALGPSSIGATSGKQAAGSAAINDPQVFQDILQGLQAFQANQVVSPAQRAALDEQIALRGKINDTFAELGKGERASIVQQFGTQMKNLQASDQLRGLAGSSLAGLGQVELEGQRQQAVGDLENNLINAQSQAYVDLGSDFANTLGETSDQNASVFAALMNLLQPQVTATQFQSQIDADNAKLAAARKGGGGGGGGGGGKSKKSSPAAPAGSPYTPGLRAPGEYHGPGGFNAAGEPGGGYGPGGDGKGKPKDSKTFNYSPTKPLISAGRN